MAPTKKNTELAPLPAQTLAEFNPRDPQTLLATAKQLAQFVTDNKLASTIQGRSYVQCEGWQFLFAVAGLDVICAKPARLGRVDGEYCYEAEARLFDSNGREVGYGYAICSDSERLKKGWAEYAIASMAQTRAIGKAGRNRFAFVMKAAGFEPTPAEEMSDIGTEAAVVDAPKKPVAEASAPASTAPAPSATAAASGSGETLAHKLEATLNQIIRELTSRHITPIERNKMMQGLNKLNQEKADAQLAGIRKACDDRTHPDALVKARYELRAFANANGAALGEEEFKRLNLRAGALTVTAVDLIQEMQEAEQRLKTPQTAAA